MRDGAERERQSFGDSAVGSVCAAAVGVIIAILIAVLPQRSVAQFPPPTFPSPLRIVVGFFAFINQPLCLLVFAVALTALMIRRKFQGVGNLAASFLIAEIVTHLIRVWMLH
jgi:uncharacterized protein YacL